MAAAAAAPAGAGDAIAAAKAASAKMESGPCCLGHVHSVTIRGRDVTVDKGLDMYVSLPDAKQGSASCCQSGAAKEVCGIVIVNDIFGWKPPNNRELTDFLASNGFVAALPDYFHADPDVQQRIDEITNPPLKPVDRNSAEFKAKFAAFQARHPYADVLADTKKVIAYLKAEHKVTRVGVLGTCWGGRVVSELAKDAALGLHAAVSLYGSRMELDKLTALVVPTCFLFGGADASIPQPDTANAIKALVPHIKVAVEVTVYPGMPHGFAHRFDAKDQVATAHATSAMRQAVHWCSKYLCPPSPDAAAAAAAAAVAKAAGPCCVGHIHSVPFRGKDVEFDSLTAGASKIPAYLSLPGDSKSGAAAAAAAAAAAGRGVRKTGLVILADIFGHKLPNNREICDYFAAQGHVALMPDFFRGDVWPWQPEAMSSVPREQMMKQFGAWTARHTPDNVLADARAAAAYLRGPAHGCTHILLLGMCWGGRQIANTLAKDKDVLKATAAVSAYGGFTDIPKLVDLCTPTRFLYGGADGSIPQPDTANAIKALVSQIRVDVDVHVFAGMPHGFMHRFDPTDPLAVDAATKALVKCNLWFAKFA